MAWPEKVSKKLRDLPDQPGVYFMRDASGKVIYVGKAVSLRKRVQSYFRGSTQRRADAKLRSLVHSVADLDLVVVRTEAEATLLEGKMIKEYRPRYNIQFKDDKRFMLLRVRRGDPFPRFTAVRLRKDDEAQYFGPYTSSLSARAAMEFIEKHFGLRPCRPVRPGPEHHRHCLNDIIRFCSAPCIGKVTPEQYQARVDEACAFLRGERPEILKALRARMTEEAAALHFEKAAALRDTLGMLHETIKRRTRLVREPETEAGEARAGLEVLRRELGLPRTPEVIEAYDISNISGTYAVASMVCAVQGLPARHKYRLFRIRTVAGSDDPAMMAEVIRRRFLRHGQAAWTPPDMVLVDGGLTQLRAARAELAQLGLGDLPTAGLAKRFEEIYAGPDGAEQIVRLPDPSPALDVLKRLRDEAHRFALTYHRKLRDRRIRESMLDEIENVGDKRKALLLQHFGSMLRLRRARVEEIAAVPGVGPALAQQIHDALRKHD